MIKYSGSGINVNRVIELSDYVFREISSGVYKVEKDRSGSLPNFVTQVFVVEKLNEGKNVTIITINNEFITNNTRESVEEKFQKLYVLKDESLGDILREYIPVDREANIGDYVHVFGHFYKKANGIFKVKDIKLSYPDIRVISYGESDRFGTPYYHGKAYRTLEPTNVIHYEGKRYRILNVFKSDSSTQVIFVEHPIIITKKDKDGNIIHIAVEPVKEGEKSEK